jgi:phage terminase large subunit GpA-like protein
MSTGLGELVVTTLRREFDAFELACRIPEFRSISQFAAEEIVLPIGGPFPGPFDLDRQPFARLWFALLEAELFPRIAVPGPTQTGKTLLCFVIVAMYYLFERGENVGLGIPQIEMSRDKWERDFKPIISVSRYADQMPEEGTGSKGGKFESITFRNGATLAFLSGSGKDAKRSGKTIRIVLCTEADKYDQPGETSRESDPVSQMVARTDAFGTAGSLVIVECSVSTPKGLVWKWYSTLGSHGRIALLCPHCQGRVTPEREHLKGWQAADNEIDARAWAHFVCPACEHPWTEEDRALANQNAVLAHRGQGVNSDGTIIGPLPKTLTGGFRWSAVNNLLRPVADFGGAEWKSRNDPDDENNQKSLMQFMWAWPYSEDLESSEITEELVATKLTGRPRAEVGDDCETVVVHIDLHSRWHYWSCLETCAGNVRTTIDYGLSLNPDGKRFGTAAAVRMGLEELADYLEGGEWVVSRSDGQVVDVDLFLVDAGFHQEIGLEFVKARGRKWRLVKGEGGKENRDGSTKYHQPKERAPDIRPGDHWCDRRQPAIAESGDRPWWLIFSDTNYWMHEVHSGFMSETFVPQDGSAGLVRRPGSFAIFGDDPAEHLRNIDAGVARSNYAQQIVGWVWRQQISKKNKAFKIGWHAQWQQDHWLDTTYGACVGDSVVRAYHPRFRPKPLPRRDEQAPRFETPDGRPYLITER